jgi:hypothetical protein
MLPSGLVSLTLTAILSLSIPRPTHSLPSSPPSRPEPPQSSGPTPAYVLTHAPLIHLARDELYWPSTLSTHLSHTSLFHSLNATPISHPPPPSPLTEHNIAFTGNRTDVYLEAGVMDEAFFRGEADWLGSEYGKPDERGRSESEVVIVLVDKQEIIGPGYLDAFYFTFYSYNEGNKLFGTRFGDHVGDWFVLCLSLSLSPSPISRYLFLNRS